ncbi:hypothetical protein LVY75_35210 (plasmid) [Sinorhizobium sp. B11]
MEHGAGASVTKILWRFEKKSHFLIFAGTPKTVLFQTDDLLPYFNSLDARSALSDQWQLRAGKLAGLKRQSAFQLQWRR